MKAEEIVRIYETSPDFDYELTRYQVDHIKGASGKDYVPPGCSTMETYGNCTETTGRVNVSLIRSRITERDLSISKTTDDPRTKKSNELWPLSVTEKRGGRTRQRLAVRCKRVNSETKAFLQRKFGDYYRKASVGLPPQFKKREWAFVLFDASYPKLVMRRHKAFSSQKEVRAYMGAVAPAHMYHSTACYAYPSATRMQARSGKART